MNKEQRNYLLDRLSEIENWINEYMEESLEKNNALTKIAEAVFWITYDGENND